MALESHFKSVPAAKGAVDPVIPPDLLLYGLAGLGCIGALGAAWFIWANLRDRARANAMIRAMQQDE